MPPKDHEPPGYRELCEKLQKEKDPVKFQAVVEEINRLLAKYEKRTPPKTQQRTDQDATQRRMHGEQQANMVKSSVMARRPDFGNNEKVWSADDLKEIARNLAILSEHAVRDVYQRAYRECAIING